MPILDQISAYRADNRTWPLWIEVNLAGESLQLWKRKNAPDPQIKRLFASYIPSLVVAIANPIAEVTNIIGNLGVCSRTTSFKLIILEEGVMISPEDETILRNNTILSGFSGVDPRLTRFICTETVITSSFLPQPRRITRLTAGTPTWRFLDSRRGIILRAELDPVGTTLDGFVTEVEIVAAPFQILPPDTQATRPGRVSNPIRRPPPNAPPNCFDPTTNEPVDCDTAEPTERDPCKEDFIKIPNPDDIIHLSPRPELPWEEVTSRRTGKKRWRLSRKLDAAETLEFIRRREVRANIERSTVPEFVKSITDIMTTIDNIQDALLSVIIFARLGIRRLPRSLYRALVGGLGIADGLQIIAFGGLDLTRIRSVKGRLMKEGQALPFSKRWRQDAVERLSRIVPTIAELFQLLQTTDWLFGVGLSLGSILGFVLDLIFGLPRGAKIRFRDPCLTQVRLDAIKHLERLGLIPMGTTPRSLQEELILPRLRELLETDIRLPSRSIRTASPDTVSPNPIPAHPFTQAEFAQLLGSYSVFLDLAEETIGDMDITPLVETALQRKIQINPDLGRSDSLLEDMGSIPTQPEPTLPLPGNPVSSPLPAVIRMIIPEARQALLNHINLDPGSVQAFYIGAFAEEIAVKAIRILDPKHETMKWTPKGGYRTLHAIMDRGFIPPENATTAQIQGALNTLLLNTDLATETPPDFTTMKNILIAQKWTGP